MGPARLRSRARRAGIRIDRELIVLPTTASPIVVLDNSEAAVQHFWSSVAAVPPGVTWAGAPASLALLLARRAPWRLTAAVAPGRVMIGCRSMSTPDGVAWSRRSAAQLLEQRGVGGVLISASRDPDAKLTFVITTRQSPGSARLVVKIPSSPAAGLAVDREGRMLVDIRRLPLGRLAASVPRYVESLVVDGRPVLVSTAVPGVPMSIGYHHWAHTARRAAVARDFGAAFDWLGAFQGSTTRGSSPADWPGQVLEAVRGRWDGHPALDRAVTRLEAARDGSPPARSRRPPCTATSGSATC